MIFYNFFMKFGDFWIPQGIPKSIKNREKSKKCWKKSFPSAVGPSDHHLKGRGVDFYRFLEGPDPENRAGTVVVTGFSQNHEK